MLVEWHHARTRPRSTPKSQALILINSHASAHVVYRRWMIYSSTSTPHSNESEFECLLFLARHRGIYIEKRKTFENISERSDAVIPTWLYVFTRKKISVSSFSKHFITHNNLVPCSIFRRLVEALRRREKTFQTRSDEGFSFCRSVWLIIISIFRWKNCGCLESSSMEISSWTSPTTPSGSAFENMNTTKTAENEKHNRNQRQVVFKALRKAKTEQTLIWCIMLNLIFTHEE